MESGAQSQLKHRKSIGSVDSHEEEVRRSIRAVQLMEEENNNDKGSNNKVSFTDSTMKLQALKLNNEVDDSDDDHSQPGTSPTMSRNSLCTGVFISDDDVALDQNQSE